VKSEGTPFLRFYELIAALYLIRYCRYYGLVSNEKGRTRTLKSPFFGDYSPFARFPARGSFILPEMKSEKGSSKNRDACRCTGWGRATNAVMAAGKIPRAEEEMTDLQTGCPTSTRPSRPKTSSRIMGSIESA